MNRKAIFNQIQNFFEEKKFNYEIFVFEDHIVFAQNKPGYKFRTSFRCTYHGAFYRITPKGTMIKIDGIEREFEKLILKDLKKNYSDEFTLFIGLNDLLKSADIRDYKITQQEHIKQYCYKMEQYLLELWEKFFEPMQNVESMASYIDQYSYSNQRKVLVSGSFPVHIFKKIFLLFKGGKMDRYQEYKKGLKTLIKSYPEINPRDKDRVPIFTNNFKSLINFLESAQN